MAHAVGKLSSCAAATDVQALQGLQAAATEAQALQGLQAAATEVHALQACKLQPLKSKRSRACKLQPLKPVHPEPVLCHEGGCCNEKPPGHNREQPLRAASRGSLSVVTKIQRGENRCIREPFSANGSGHPPSVLDGHRLECSPSLAPLPPSTLCHELHSKCQQLYYKEAGSSKILNKDLQILNLKVLLNSHPLVCHYLW